MSDRAFASRSLIQKWSNVIPKPSAGYFFKADFNVSGFAMFDGVGDGFLRDPIKVGAAFGII